MAERQIEVIAPEARYITNGYVVRKRGIDA
jgi:hypothetical protein